MEWKQKGFAVVSVARAGQKAMPMVHSFSSAEWEAQSDKRKAEQLPENLREGLEIVPATLTFDMSN